MSDATQKCPVCASVNPSRAKFCGECGAPMPRAAVASTAGVRLAGPNPVLPWFIAGVCVIALQTAVVLVALHRPGEAVPDAALSAASATPVASRGAPPDISNMSPREAADRLYERIARAASAGDTAQVQFFAPMALNAYSNVSPLDADARLHVGLIDLALGNNAGAAAQGDSIARLAGTNLFGPLLKARAAEARGNRAEAAAAYRIFLGNYDSERRKNLPEYQQHDALLVEAHTAAQRAGR
ncbi:MAG TPA: zinc ribbon domain-containing protein [Gemmatimonadales bacterium]|jgi:hypothetical protein